MAGSIYVSETIDSVTASRRSSLVWVHGARIAAGAILLGAALLKVFMPAKPLWIMALGLRGDALVASIIAGEVALGLALLLNYTPRWIYPLSSACFLAFAGYSFYLWSQSAQSCGCFGRIIVPPLVTASIDVLMTALLVLAAIHARRELSKPPRKSRLILSVCAGLVVATGATFHNRSAMAKESSAISVDQAYIDMGMLNELQAKRIDHTFILTNHTEKPVEITGIDHTCTCTSVSAEQNIIPPGQTTAIRVSIDWTGRRGAQMAGVSVLTRNPAGVIDLTLRGIINAGIGVSPSVLNLGHIEPGVIVERLITLGRTDQPAEKPEPLCFSDINSSTDAIKIEPIVMPDQSADSVWFRVMVAADKLPASDKDIHITFVPADQKLKPVNLPVHFERMPLVDASASSLRFNVGGVQTQVTHFTMHGDDTPEFTIVEDSAAPSGMFVIKSIKRLANSSRQIDVEVESKDDSMRILQGVRLVAKIKNQEAASVSLLRF